MENIGVIVMHLWLRSLE